MLPGNSIWSDDYYDRFNDFHVALIIIILVIGFVLLCCVTGGIWLAMAQRNKKASRRAARNPAARGYVPYVGEAGLHPTNKAPSPPLATQEPLVVECPPPASSRLGQQTPV